MSKAPWLDFSSSSLTMRDWHCRRPKAERMLPTYLNWYLSGLGHSEKKWRAGLSACLLHLELVAAVREKHGRCSLTVAEGLALSVGRTREGHSGSCATGRVLPPLMSL